MQGDGLSPVPLGAAEEIIIAGMGGEVISEIIDKSPLTRDKNLNLVLQPMSRSEYLISYLYENGFEINSQKCVISKGKCYTVMAASFTGEKAKISPSFPYIGKLDLKDETNIIFIKTQLRHLENKSKGDSSLLQVIEEIKKVIL